MRSAQLPQLSLAIAAAIGIIVSTSTVKSQGFKSSFFGLPWGSSEATAIELFPAQTLSRIDTTELGWRSPYQRYRARRWRGLDNAFFALWFRDSSFFSGSVDAETDDLLLGTEVYNQLLSELQSTFGPADDTGPLIPSMMFRHVWHKHSAEITLLETYTTYRISLRVSHEQSPPEQKRSKKRRP